MQRKSGINKRRNKLVYGVGINDSDYVTQRREVYITEDGSKKKRLLWMCPFYSVWVSMLSRCYSEKCQSKMRNYIGCCVCGGWLYFSNFRSWMEQQDWEGNDLDKDLLVEGNKEYGPDRCIFMPHEVNTFMTERKENKGEFPTGVSKDKRSSGFTARISLDNKQIFLGIFSTPLLAEEAWVNAKLEGARELSKHQSNPIVAKLLVLRYEARRNAIRELLMKEKDYE